MESTISSARTYRRLSLVESVFAYTGKVLAARPWDSPGFTEIDLHLPGTDMRNWSEAVHIKTKVASFAYRDYSPAFWDADTCTCTLLVETDHDGPGAKWGSQVQAGDPFHFLKIGSSHQALSQTGRNILLGDSTAAGHFAGMLQSAPSHAEIAGAVEWNSATRCREFSAYYSSLGLEPLLQKGNAGLTLENWVRNCKTLAEDRFFLAGGVRMVSLLRRVLKESGVPAKQINAQGFWR